jgi:hypothetical protein
MLSIKIVYIKKNELKVHGTVLSVTPYRLLNDSVMQAKLLELLPQSKSVYLITNDTDAKNWEPILVWLNTQGFHIKRLPNLHTIIDIGVIAIVIVIIGIGLWIYQLIRITEQEIRQYAPPKLRSPSRQINSAWPLFIALSQAPLVPDSIRVSVDQCRLTGFVPSQNQPIVEAYLRQIQVQYPHLTLTAKQDLLPSNAATYITIQGSLQ